VLLVDPPMGVEPQTHQPLCPDCKSIFMSLIGARLHLKEIHLEP
jgi:Zn finger protein HypA/HybF involved in hydrogenase expression